MAHWGEAVVTNEGVDMLNEWMAGRTIKVTSAYGGTGTVDLEELREQTGLVNPKQELHLLGDEDGPDGKTIQVQVQNTQLEESYELNQVGIFAKLDPDKDPDGPERLLFIMQDEKGVSIPEASEATFLLELYCMVGITNNGRFEVSVSAAGIVTAAYLRQRLEQALDIHNDDPNAHHSLKFRMKALEIVLNGSGTIIGEGNPTAETEGMKGQHYINPDTGEEFECTDVTQEGCVWEPVDNQESLREQIAQVSAASERVEVIAAGVDARLTLLELMYRTQVSGNPFTVTFASLEGTKSEGVWNQPMARLEF